MKTLLVSVNASYSHTNIAVRSIYQYVKKNNPNIQIDFDEFTINQPVMEVLQGIQKHESDLILFSTYIWNSNYVCSLIKDIKKIRPQCIVGAGGPEFSYSAIKYLSKLETLDFVMFGEGEQTVLEILENNEKTENFSVKDVRGVFFRDEKNILYSGDRSLIKNLDEIPFSYEISEITANPDHKIYYYESSRGCPFSCSYCLSSVDKNVRFKSLDRVYKDLQIFLDANVSLVKFVDRTYNLNEERYLSIWKYILDNHNGKTMFHFEIEAEYLSEKALDFLQNVPEHVMQFEMGVQTSNKQTLKEINRSPNTETLAKNIKRIPKTIHQHLDLIAGLPYEDLEIFGKSFDYVMELKPDALQLGFLKVLNGTFMENYAKEKGWQWQSEACYEVLSTPYMSFSDLTFLKYLETLVDAYWNKFTFRNTMNYLFKNLSPWSFFSTFTTYGVSKNTFEAQRKESYWFELLNDFMKSVPFENLDYNLIYDLLRYDFVRSGKKGAFPNWYVHHYSKEEHRKLLEQNDMLNNSRIGFAFSEYEEFNYNVLADNLEKKHMGLLIKYK